MPRRGRRSIGSVARWLVERRLTQAAERLERLRVELAQVDEQLGVVANAADDHELRALVSETPLAAQEAAEARKHADALGRHRDQIRYEISELEARSDRWLDELARG
jgi:chromosome segregation ATPase